MTPSPSPRFIARVRRKLALDQCQAAAIFGGDAIACYEIGKPRPRSRW